MLCKFQIYLSPLWWSQNWSFGKSWDWVSWQTTIENTLWNLGTTKELMHAVKSRSCNRFFFAGGDFPMASWWKEWNLYIRKKPDLTDESFLKENFRNVRNVKFLNRGAIQKFLQAISSTPTSADSSSVRFFNLESNLYIRRKVSANIERFWFGRQFFEIRGRKSVDITKQQFNQIKIFWRNVSDFDIDGRTQAYR